MAESRIIEDSLHNEHDHIQNVQNACKHNYKCRDKNNMEMNVIYKILLKLQSNNAIRYYLGLNCAWTVIFLCLRLIFFHIAAQEITWAAFIISFFTGSPAVVLIVPAVLLALSCITGLLILYITNTVDNAVNVCNRVIKKVNSCIKDMTLPERGSILLMTVGAIFGSYLGPIGSLCGAVAGIIFGTLILDIIKNKPSYSVLILITVYFLIAYMVCIKLKQYEYIK